MADPANPNPAEQVGSEPAAAPDYLEDENGVLTDDSGNPWLELA